MGSDKPEQKPSLDGEAKIDKLFDQLEKLADKARNKRRNGEDIGKTMEEFEKIEKQIRKG